VVAKLKKKIKPGGWRSVIGVSKHSKKRDLGAATEIRIMQVLKKSKVRRGGVECAEWSQHSLRRRSAKQQ